MGTPDQERKALHSPRSPQWGRAWEGEEPVELSTTGDDHEGKGRRAKHTGRHCTPHTPNSHPEALVLPATGHSLAIGTPVDSVYLNRGGGSRAVSRVGVVGGLLGSGDGTVTSTPPSSPKYVFTIIGPSEFKSDPAPGCRLCVSEITQAQ